MQHPIPNRLDVHDGDLFRCPSDLAVTPLPATRALLVGVCTADHLQGFLREVHQIESDFVHIGSLNDPNAALPRPVEAYDFQIVVLPLDYVMPAHLYFRMRYSDAAAEQARFDTSAAEIQRLLGNALRWNRAHGLLTFVGNFLVPQINPVGRFLPRYDLRNPRYYVEKLNEVLTLSVEQHKNAFMLDIDGIVSSFGKRYTQDDSIWADCHGAFFTELDHEFEKTREGAQQRLESLAPVSSYYSTRTREAYIAMTEEIVLSYRAVRQIDAVKLVVIDLDDTAWRGIAAEAELSVEFQRVGWPLGFIEALMYLKRRGVLLSIISKNEMTNAVTAWERVYGGFFPLSNFVSIKVNWKSKAENMEEILAETNLLPKSVVYIDDNPVEREAIHQAFPDIRLLGANPYYLRRILLWSAELQPIAITDESDRRTEMVQNQIVRETSKRQMSHEEFQASLGVQVTTHVVTSVDDPRFARMFELVNKTNQFNTTGKRWTHADYVEGFALGLRGYAMDVSDRFSQYGIVCIALVLGPVIEQFVMSCRVIGLGVETATLAVVEADLKHSGHSEVRATATETAANVLSRDLYSRTGYEQDGGEWRRALNVTTAIPAHVTLQPA